MIIYCDKYFFISDNIGNLYTLLVSRHFPDPRTRPSFLWYTSSPHTRAITNPISLYNTIRFLSAVWVNWRKCNFYSISGFIFRFFLRSKTYTWHIKHGIEKVFAFILLIFSLPILILFALLIKLTRQAISQQIPKQPNLANPLFLHRFLTINKIFQNLRN